MELFEINPFVRFAQRRNYIPKYNNFVMTGKINASGNIQSLLYKNEILNEISSKCCFSGLFRDCKALLIPPNLNATILGDYCYAYLFSGCTELKLMPLLPATTLK